MSATVLKRRATNPRGPRAVLVVVGAAIWVMTLGFFAGIAGSSWAPEPSAAATGENKALFVAVSNSYNATVVEFNVVVDSFAACSAAQCVSSAIEGLSDTRFYDATVALEKTGRIPQVYPRTSTCTSATSSPVQRTDVNAVAKAATTTGQKSIVTRTLEYDVDNLAFRGMSHPHLPG